MSDYIRREDALNIDFRCNVRMFESRLKTAERAVQAYADAIADLPAADVVERKSGEWVSRKNEPKHQDWWTCSECSGQFSYKWNFCPNCGADMRGET